jgi:3D (Asp-Asp-Asp) domain-containing protein
MGMMKFFRQIKITGCLGALSALSILIIHTANVFSESGSKSIHRTALPLSNSIIIPIGHNIGSQNDQTEPAESDDPANSLPQWQTVRMRVTAYCPCPICCGRLAQGRTANGHLIRQGERFVAADKKYPFGTELIVPYYNNGKPIKVIDRGGAIKGNCLDLFFDDHNKAVKWGVKFLDVKVKISNE